MCHSWWIVTSMIQETKTPYCFIKDVSATEKINSFSFIFYFYLLTDRKNKKRKAIFCLYMKYATDIDWRTEFADWSREMKIINFSELGLRAPQLCLPKCATMASYTYITYNINFRLKSVIAFKYYYWLYSLYIIIKILIVKSSHSLCT